MVLNSLVRKVCGLVFMIGFEFFVVVLLVGLVVVVLLMFLFCSICVGGNWGMEVRCLDVEVVNFLVGCLFFLFCFVGGEGRGWW